MSSWVSLFNFSIQLSAQKSEVGGGAWLSRVSWQPTHSFAQAFVFCFVLFCTGVTSMGTTHTATLASPCCLAPPWTSHGAGKTYEQCCVPEITFPTPGHLGCFVHMLCMPRTSSTSKMTYRPSHVPGTKGAHRRWELCY